MTYRTPQRQTARTLADVLDLLAIVIAIGLVALIYEHRTGLARTFLALAFTCYVPGRAVVSNWPKFGRWSAVAMPMAFSLGLLALLATVSLWVHAWHPLGLLDYEAALSVAGLLAGVLRRHFRRRRTPWVAPASPPARVRADDRPRTRRYPA